MVLFSTVIKRDKFDLEKGGNQRWNINPFKSIKLIIQNPGAVTALNNSKVQKKVNNPK